MYANKNSECPEFRVTEFVGAVAFDQRRSIEQMRRNRPLLWPVIMRGKRADILRKKTPTATEEYIIDLIKHIPNFRIAMGFKSSMQATSSTVYFKLKMDRKLVLSSK